MEDIKLTERLNDLFAECVDLCKERRYEFITPEVVLHALLGEDVFCSVIDFYCDITALEDELEEKLAEMDRVPEEVDYQLMPSDLYTQLMGEASLQVISSSAEALDTPHVVVALLPGNYTLEIEGASIEPFTMKINVPNAPGKKIENTKAVLKIKK